MLKTYNEIALINNRHIKYFDKKDNILTRSYMSYLLKLSE